MKLLITVPKNFSNGSALKKIIKGVCVNKKPTSISITESNAYINQLGYHYQSDTSEYRDYSHHIIIIDTNKTHTTKIQTVSLNDNVRIYTTDLCSTANIKRKEDYDLYIGRGSIFGNPYSRSEGITKQECIHNHSYDFERGILPRLIEIKRFFKNNHLSSLGCFCAPSSCHGDVYCMFINKHRAIVPLCRSLV